LVEVSNFFQHFQFINLSRPLHNTHRLFKKCFILLVFYYYKSNPNSGKKDIILFINYQTVFTKFNSDILIRKILIVKIFDDVVCEDKNPMAHYYTLKNNGLDTVNENKSPE